jgi:hypothetical protein
MKIGPFNPDNPVKIYALVHPRSTDSKKIKLQDPTKPTNKESKILLKTSRRYVKAIQQEAKKWHDEFLLQKVESYMKSNMMDKAKKLKIIKHAEA